MRRSSSNMTPFYVMEVLERAKDMESEGRSIVHLEVGEPQRLVAEVMRRFSGTAGETPALPPPFSISPGASLCWKAHGLRLRAELLA